MLREASRWSASTPSKPISLARAITVRATVVLAPDDRVVQLRFRKDLSSSWSSASDYRWHFLQKKSEA
jgi:hypothetical protein